MASTQSATTSSRSRNPDPVSRCWTRLEDMQQAVRTLSTELVETSAFIETSTSRLDKTASCRDAADAVTSDLEYLDGAIQDVTNSLDELRDALRYADEDTD